MKKEILNLALKIPYFKEKLYARRKWVTLSEAQSYIETADVVTVDNLGKKPYVGIVKDKVTDDFSVVNKRASWLRYERFLRNNNILFDYFDIERSDWIVEAKKFDIIIWHTESSPCVQSMAESKIYFLESVLKKCCFPSFYELWRYENKSRADFLYDHFNLPMIPSFISNSYGEVRDYIKGCDYPIISKIDTASGSSGVHKIDNYSSAKKYVDSVFSESGRKTSYPYLNHKGYVYFQKFIDDATFDLRIFIVDNKAFGYYRYPNKGDFRASGAGNVEKKELPNDALRLAIHIAKTLNSRLIGVDLLYSKKDSKYYIIETSVFNQIGTPEQLVIDGVPGYYDISDIDNIHFVQGRFWLQELSLKSVIEDWCLHN